VETQISKCERPFGGLRAGTRLVWGAPPALKQRQVQTQIPSGNDRGKGVAIKWRLWVDLGEWLEVAVLGVGYGLVGEVAVEGVDAFGEAGVGLDGGLGPQFG